MEPFEIRKREGLIKNDTIRKYLLGQLIDDRKMRELEEKLMLDDDFADELSAEENNLIEDYVDGTLTEPERQQFIKHFLILPERREQLKLIENLRRYSNKKTTQLTDSITTEKTVLFDWEKLFKSFSFRFATVLILAVGIGLIVWRAGYYQSDVEKGLAELRTAYRSGQRPLESRTTAGLDYAPYEELRGEPSTGDARAKQRAESFLLIATEDKQNAEAYHALGLLYLTEKKFDQALEEFKRAQSLAPDSATISSDIGATLLEKAKQAEKEEKFGESMEAKAESLKALNRAVELDGFLLEALFNRALVLQKMPAPAQAKEAWEKYLEKDSTSLWATEARRNLEVLKQRSGNSRSRQEVISDFLVAFHNKDDGLAWKIASQTKELITDVIIYSQISQNFLEASRDKSRKEEADKILSAFLYLGELERKNAGDAFFSELAGFYRDTNQLQELRLAREELKSGYQFLLKANWSDALKTFEQAKKSFSDIGNSWEANVAEYQIAYCLSQTKEIKESNNRLLLLLEISKKNNYKWLSVLASGWIGNNYTLLGEHSSALYYNQQFLKSAEEIGDTYNAQKAFNQLANQYWQLGNRSAMLDSIYRGLNFSNLYFLSARQKSRNLLFAVESLYRFRFYDAAAALGQEEVYVAENELKDNWLSHTAHNHLALIYAKNGNLEQGMREIEAGFHLADSFQDPAMRQKLNTKNRINLAHLQRETNNCREAVGNYTLVLDDYGNTDFSLNKYEARKGKLLCLVHLHDDAGVEEEMTVLLKIYDDNRRMIAEDQNRNIFFDQEQSVYDIATDYAYTYLHNSEQAFDYAENSRARSLLDLIEDKELKNRNEFDKVSEYVAKAPTQSLSLKDIQQKLPAGAELLYYAVLPDKLLIWHISNAEVNTFEQSVSAEVLNEKIQNYDKLLLEKNPEIDIAGKELYELLIKPIENKLDPQKVVCIVADKLLFKLPFASLIDHETSQYLIEKHSLIYAPSATIFIEKTENSNSKAKLEKEKLAGFGNSLFSRSKYPDLSDLPDAEKEVNEIASFYEAPKIFVRRDATKKQFLSNLATANIVHFAGHFVPDNRMPERSRLLLAENDELTVSEIMRNGALAADTPYLVILSACDTGIETVYNGEGMIGSARAFLATGVPLVIGSQWSVDSDATAELMIKFHYYRRRHQGMSSIGALRRAQIDLLKSENSAFKEPFYWAGFLPVGAYTESF